MATSSVPYKEAPIDQLTKKTAQLFAMLVTIYGEGAQSFHSYNDEIKNDYLWACADLAKEIDLLVGEAWDAPKHKKGGAQ